MKNSGKKQKNRSFCTETAVLGADDGMQTVSSCEATGLMYCPPRSEDEMRSDGQLFTLQVHMPQDGFIGNNNEPKDT